VSVTSDITAGIAVLAASSSAGLTWRADGSAYLTSETGIYRKRLPDGLRGVAVTIVPQSDDPSQPLGRVMIQLKARGTKNRPSDPDDILDACFDVMHGSTDLAMGSCTLIQLNRGVRVPMGDDTTGAWELIDQYYADVDYPPTALRPDGGSW
jgi:hypothetical protein